MRRFFLKKKKSSKAHNKNEPNSFPTALERVAAARKAQADGSILMPTRSPARGTPPPMMFCPMAGKELLQTYEDCRNNATRDNSDESGSDDDECLHPESQAPTDPTTKLHKPIKPNRLLNNALTNANGDAWRRQRPLVQRALGDTAVTKKNAVPAATEAALDLLCQQTRRGRSPSEKTHTIEIEVRKFSLNVAVATVIAAVFGNWPNEEMHKKLETGISDLFYPTLLPVRYDSQKAAALDLPVRETVKSIAKKIEASERHSCLALNLLEQELKGTPTQPTLSRDEVIGNCHSALLAGAQTIATTLAGSLLHLAEYQRDSEHESDRAFYRAVVNETLRILPPVGSLPRCLVNGGQRIPRTYPPCDGDMVNFPEGGMLVLDVLSMAHCPFSEEENNLKLEDENSSWKFCPSVGSTPPKNVPRSYPWGFGDRICPAGNLSVSCISAVLETLIAKEKWTWTFSNARGESVGPTGCQGWMSSVSYQPTLTYPNPLWLTLSRTDSGN